MNCLLFPPIFAAEHSRWDSLSNGFRGGFQRHGLEPLDIAMGVAALAGIVAAVWILTYLLAWRDRRRSYTSPRRLFLSLCRAHRLRWIECWWLWRLARCQRLAEPAKLFLEPERFEKVHLTPTLWAKAEFFGRLRDRLFTGLVAEEVSAPSKPVPLKISDPPKANRGTPPLLPVVASTAIEIPPYVPALGSKEGTPTVDWFRQPV
jgi:hypothetical protein